MISIGYHGKKEQVGIYIICVGGGLYPIHWMAFSLDRVVHDHIHIGKFQTKHDNAFIILKLMMAHMYVKLYTHTHTMKLICIKG